MLGCIIVFGLQTAMDQKAQGYILAFGVGMLTFACCEMSCKVTEGSKPGEWGKYAQRMFLFVLGVTIIGLTMLCKSRRVMLLVGLSIASPGSIFLPQNADTLPDRQTTPLNSRELHMEAAMLTRAMVMAMVTAATNCRSF